MLIFKESAQSQSSIQLNTTRKKIKLNENQNMHLALVSTYIELLLEPKVFIYYQAHHINNDQTYTFHI